MNTIPRPSNHRARPLSFWTPYNLLDVRLPPPLGWIEDLHLNWEPGYCVPAQTKIWSTNAPLTILSKPYTSNYEPILVVAPLFGEGIKKPFAWYRRGGCGGLLLPTLDFISAIHKFYPSLLFAEVILDGIRTIEPYKKEWGAPKAAMDATARQKWSL